MEITMTSGLVFMVACFVIMAVGGLGCWFLFNKANANELHDKPIAGWVASGIVSALLVVVSFVGLISSSIKLFEKLEW